MQQAGTKQGLVVFGGIVFTLFILNYAVRLVTGYPAIYCATRWAMTPLIAPYWCFALPALTVILLFVLFAGKGWQTAAGVIALMLLAGAMPDFLKTLGELGVACH